MLITGEIQLVMQSKRSQADHELLAQIYTSFIRLKVNLDELRRMETAHKMVDDSHELKIALEGLDSIREHVLISHEMYKVYCYRGDLRHQIQEITDNYNA